MTPGERVLAVYEGRVPDQVPLILDLSHWYKKNYNIPFDLSGLSGVEEDLVALHKELGAVSYVEMGSFYDLFVPDDDVEIKSWTEDGVFYTRLTTPLGELHEERVFEKSSYSYNIRKHLLDSVDDFDIVMYVMDRIKCMPRWDKYRAWQDALGDFGFIYCNLPYSGSGYLISRNFGVEKTIYACMDFPQKVKKLVDTVNNCNLSILDSIINGPFNVCIISDNYDSTVQSPVFFEEYVRNYYTEVAARLHKNGKYLAVHIDGEMRGSLRNMASCGVDCADALTPAPMFSMTPVQMREEAGSGLIMSGGIPATAFGNTGSDEEFDESVKAWLDTRKLSSRLLMAAGDQVPTDAPWERIRRLPALVEKYGQY